MELLYYLNICLLAVFAAAGDTRSGIVECAKDCYSKAAERHGSYPSPCNQMVIRDIAECASTACSLTDLAHLSTHFALSCAHFAKPKQKRGDSPSSNYTSSTTSKAPPPTSSTKSESKSDTNKPPPYSSTSSATKTESKPPPSSSISGKPPPPPPPPDCRTYHPCITKITTTVVQTFITFCPTPTVIVVNHQTYSVTAPTTLTVTNCPCTVTSNVEVPSTMTQGAGGGSGGGGVGETGGTSAPTGLVVSSDGGMSGGFSVGKEAVLVSLFGLVAGGILICL